MNLKLQLFLTESVCVFVLLENSQVASARFQAAAAIKEAAIREWSFLSTEDKGGLIRLFSLLLFMLFC